MSAGVGFDIRMRDFVSEYDEGALNEITGIRDELFKSLEKMEQDVNLHRNEGDEASAIFCEGMMQECKNIIKIIEGRMDKIGRAN